MVQQISHYPGNAGRLNDMGELRWQPFKGAPHDAVRSVIVPRSGSRIGPVCRLRFENAPTHSIGREKRNRSRSTNHYGLPRALPRYCLADAIKRYCGDVLPTKSRDARQRQYYQLKRWQDLLGNILIDEVTPGSIARARDELIRESLAPATVVRYLAALSHLYTVASNEWEWLDHHPVRRVRRPKQPQGRVRFLTKDELSALLSACQ